MKFLDKGILDVLVPVEINGNEEFIIDRRFNAGIKIKNYDNFLYIFYFYIATQNIAI